MLRVGSERQGEAQAGRLEGRSLAELSHRGDQREGVQARRLQVAQGGLARGRGRPAATGGARDGCDQRARGGGRGAQSSARVARGERGRGEDGGGDGVSEELPEGWSVAPLATLVDVL